MELNEAIQLIRKAGKPGRVPESWADLGCGSGLFTHALLSVLPEGSIVHAVDKNQTLTDKNNQSIVFHHADFEKENLPFSDLDGILMANSLHYVADQLLCVSRLNAYLRFEGGRYILVEYDSEAANQWVPYPLPFAKAKQLFTRSGFSHIEKIGEKKSLYGRGNIYVCVISR